MGYKQNEKEFEIQTSYVEGEWFILFATVWVGLGAKDFASLGTTTFQDSSSTGRPHPSAEAMRACQ